MTKEETLAFCCLSTPLQEQVPSRTLEKHCPCCSLNVITFNVFVNAYARAAHGNYNCSYNIKTGGCVKTPNINKKNSLYVLVWMYNEFLFFYKKSLINNLYGVILVK